MLETGCGFRFSAKSLQMRFGGPRAQADHFERHGAIEAFLMGAINHALTAATDLFQQFVIAQLSQYLGNARCFLVLASSSRSILFNISSRAAVRRHRQGYGGRVADG
jgi:hypothetical protein